jgi:vesicle-fusing ATPase
MDGVDPLCVPTLVIGMTNRRSLIEPALLRPGRFEVQIEVPKPRTVEQRISILSVHMNNMFKTGRMFVRDAPEGTAAWKRMQKQKDEYEKNILSKNPDTGAIPAGFTHNGKSTVPTYDELLDNIAVKCDGMSGASLAGVARAAASRALERAVCDFAGHFDSKTDSPQEGHSIADCLVTMTDFDNAIEDVMESGGRGDGGEEDDDKALDDAKKEDADDDVEAPDDAEKEDADDDSSS